MTVLASSLRHMSSMSESLGAVGKVELDQLARADVVDAGKAEALERMVDRLALRVEHAGLEGDEDARFHEFSPADAGSPPYGRRGSAGASFKLCLP